LFRTRNKASGRDRRRPRLVFCLLLFLARIPCTASSNSDHLEEAARLINAGDLAAAEKEARLALGDPSARPLAWATLGAIRIRQKNYVAATEFLNAALRLDPGLLEARMALGEVYLLTGKLAQARESFASVLHADRDDREARFALVKLDSDRGRFSLSLSEAEPILGDLRRDPQGIVALAKDYVGLKRKEQLSALAQDWSVLQEVSADSSVEFASLLVKSGLEPEAISVLQKAKDAAQVSFDLAFALASLYFSKGDLNHAFDLYDGAVSLNPNCITCLEALAKISIQQKDPEKALAYLIKAKHQQPRNPEILFEFGKACLELDLPDDAIEALQKAASLQPHDDSYSYVLASANVAKKQYANAAKIFQALLAKHPNDPVLNYAMGSLLFLEVKLDEAQVYLRRSVELQSDQVAPYYYLALIAEGKGDNEQAVVTLRDVLHRDPGYGPAYEAMGKILLKQQKYPEAQEALEKAVRLNPDSVKAHYQLGILLGRTGKQVDANKEFEIVRQLNAESEKRLGSRRRIISPH
jgi:tetratricopeptide (TPR) repeat protein